MLNVSPAVCHKGACSALVLSEQSAARLSARANKLEKDWHVPVAQPQQASSSECVPEPVPDLLCPNTDVPWPLSLGIRTLTRNYSSDLFVRQGLFLPGKPRQIHILTLPSAAEQLAIVPDTFCTDPRTPREMVFSFVFTSLTFAATIQQLTELPTHAVLAGKRLAGVSQQGSITPEWRAAFVSPFELRFREGVFNKDVAEQNPARLKATPFPL